MYVCVRFYLFLFLLVYVAKSDERARGRRGWAVVSVAGMDVSLRVYVYVCMFVSLMRKDTHKNVPPG